MMNRDGKRITINGHERDTSRERITEANKKKKEEEEGKKKQIKSYDFILLYCLIRTNINKCFIYTWREARYGQSRCTQSTVLCSAINICVADVVVAGISFFWVVYGARIECVADFMCLIFFVWICLSNALALCFYKFISYTCNEMNANKLIRDPMRIFANPWISFEM